ncbi:MAG: ATP-grasp domain-containing protein, partial [Neisseriaceae bacterium]|nr:ATP-grasp domain-containing protein [Neisseriaceae bacterium]
LSPSIKDEIRRQTKEMAKALQVVGLMNVQFAVQNDVVYVLEVNPRASRTVPFVSKATGVPLAKVGARVMVGEKLSDIKFTKEIIPEYYFVKEAVFPFIKFPGVDTILGPEMRSTGEVMGIGKTFPEAFIKSQLGAGSTIPDSGCVFMSVRDEDKVYLPQIATNFLAGGYTLCATKGTATYLQEKGFDVEVVNKVIEGRPHIVDKIKNGEISIVINTVDNKVQSIQDSHSIRRSALTQNVPLYTTIAAGLVVSRGIGQLNVENTYSLQSLHSQLHLSFHY